MTTTHDFYAEVEKFVESLERSMDKDWWWILDGCPRPLTEDTLADLARWWATEATSEVEGLTADDAGRVSEGLTAILNKARRDAAGRKNMIGYSEALGPEGRTERARKAAASRWGGPHQWTISQIGGSDWADGIADSRSAAQHDAEYAIGSRCAQGFAPRGSRYTVAVYPEGSYGEGGKSYIARG